MDSNSANHGDRLHPRLSSYIVSPSKWQWPDQSGMLQLLETCARRGSCWSALINESGCCRLAVVVVHRLGEEFSKKQISSPLRDQLLSGEKKILINGWHGLQLLGLQTFSKFQVPRKHGSAVQVTSRAAVSALGTKDHDHDTVDYLLRAKESLPFLMWMLTGYQLVPETSGRILHVHLGHFLTTTSPHD